MRDFIAFIQQEISSVTNIPLNTLDLETPFSGFGIDSLQAVTIASNISKKLDRELSLTVFFDYPNIRALADFLAGKDQSVRETKDLSKQMPVAIIGLACRFPGANTIDQFWKNLSEGKNSIREVPRNRWDYTQFADLPALRWGGFLEDIEGFDAEMFGISEAEASHMDPQQKLLLECVHEALENSGITRDQLNQSATGVFVGISSNDYSTKKIRSGKEATVLDAIGNSHSIASNRISYIYNLRGPSLSIDTACSSSLVALHKACQSIESGECDQAIVAGVNILLDPQISVAFANAGMLAPDGQCKSFSKEADGYVRSEGVGAIIIQKATLAESKRVHALVLGTAVNHDGKTNGLTAPSGPAQEEVIRTALRKAQLAPNDINLIEAHGTGTALGDPIEFFALAKIFSEAGESKNLRVGSAKAFIGHLEAAAGIAGIIKTALSISKRQFVKQVLFTEINPKMQSALKGISVLNENVFFSADESIKVGVSSFGFGGTNAHAILASADSVTSKKTEELKEPLYLSISATHSDSLRSSAERWEAALGSISESLILRSNQERLEYRNRLCFFGISKQEIMAAIASWKLGKRGNWIQCDFPKAYRPKLALQLAGKEENLAIIAYALAENSANFAFIWRECLAYFEGYYSECLSRPADAGLRSNAKVERAIQFCARYSLLRFLFEEYGIEPDIIYTNTDSELATAAALKLIGLDAFAKSVIEGNIGFDFSSAESKIEVLPNAVVSGGGSEARFIYTLGESLDWQRSLAELAIRKLLRPRHISSIDSLPSTAFYHKNFKANGNQELKMENAILSELQLLVADLLHVSPAEVDPDTNLIDLGADSLLLLSAIQTIKEKHGVSIAVADLFRNLNTLRAICAYVIEHKPKEEAPAAPVAENKPERVQKDEETRKVVAAMNAEAVKSNVHVRGDLQGIIESQLAIMQSQLQLLGGHAAPSSMNVAPAVVAMEQSISESATPKQVVEAKGVLGNWRAKANREVSAEEKAKEKYIKEFIARFNARTQKTKAHTQKYRKHLADNRVSAGFRPNLKEMIYTIIFQSGKGSHFLDLDGNDYIDYSMGFGVNLFGHCPDFIEDKIRKQLEIGYCVGPQAELAGIVAEKACKVVQHERIAFLNSGTEAVMTAIRLARAVSGRNRVVIFEGSYHGHADVVLARAASQGGASLPVAPGVPTGIVGDVVVLPYGEQSSIDYIRKNGDSLAAVLVEPVQSRYPEHQPVDFLREIRKITTHTGTAFIFDEVICGLRVAPAGAEQLFQIKPDISVYGKILGGGMPIGAVAGFAKYLNPIDGGDWRFGDDSYPGAEMTFFAGTFCKHPVTMAAAEAVLDRFLLEGDAITKNLNQRTTALCDRINKEFQGFDIQANNFGSLFRFKSPSNIDLLFANINYRGAYVWEGRNLFLSTAHTQEDEDNLVKIVRASVDELQHEGFLRKKG